MKRLVLFFIFLALVTPCLAAKPIVQLETNYGNIVIELDKDAAPVTVANFFMYVNSGFYDGLIFHRTIDGFMIQGGGFDRNLNEQDPCEPIVNESNNGLSNLRGTIAMARTSEPNSATSQFFINHVDNIAGTTSNLDWQDANNVGYCVFGRVISDMNVVDAIAQVPTVNLGGAFATLPEIPVVIYSASLLGDTNTDSSVNLLDFSNLAGQWLQCDGNDSFKITEANTVADDYFGFSTSIGSDYAIVGAPGDVPYGNNAGSLYVYTKEDGNWLSSNPFVLTASDALPGDWFGYSAAVNTGYADSIIVGAPGADDQTGSAYVFAPNETDPNNWDQLARFTASDANSGDWFGNSVSIDSMHAIVGAYYDNNQAGAAYIFHENETWSQNAKLTAADAASGDKFGNSVSISGNYAIVGAYMDDNLGIDAGSAYIFKWSGSSWTQQAKLIPSDADDGDQFGYSVCINGDYALVGAVGDDDDGNFSGSAYIFKRNGTVWVEQAKLTASDAAAFDWFGYSVSIDAGFTIISSRWDDDKGSKSGSAYIFRREGTNWVQQTKLTAFDGAADDHFGNSVSLSGNYALTGSPQDDAQAGNSGSAYIFEICPSYDITGDCMVDMDDITAIGSNWLIVTP